jgi:hypothetical protein
MGAGRGLPACARVCADLAEQPANSWEVSAMTSTVKSERLTDLERLADLDQAYSRAMLLLGWFAGRHVHRSLDGEPVKQSDCWGCQQISALMQWNERYDR